jgi:hypothetical protein
LDIDVLDALDFEDYVDGDEEVGGFGVRLLDENAVCEAGVVGGHFEVG